MGFCYTASAVSPSIPELAVVPQPGNVVSTLLAGSANQEAGPIPFMRATSSSTPTPVGEGPVMPLASVLTDTPAAGPLSSHPILPHSEVPTAHGPGDIAGSAAWHMPDTSDVSD